MEIQAGKFYRTRDGRKVGPMAGSNEHFRWVEGKATGKDHEWCPKTGRHRGGYGMTSQDDLIAEWQDEPVTWGQMTDAEKGALLLAAHEGKMIEVTITGKKWRYAPSPIWDDGCAYRIRPEPKRETVVGRLHILDGSWPQSVPVTLVVEDGKPDCASIKMEEL